MLPLGPDCVGKTSDSGCADADGVTVLPLVLMSNVVRSASDSADWAASILEDSAILREADIDLNDPLADMVITLNKN